MPLAVVVVSVLLSQSARGDEVDYLRDIKPMLKARCYACHGALKQESGLRLDAGNLIRNGGDSGAVVSPGKADQSPLIKRVATPERSERMPPEGEPLTAEQIDKLRQWISQGAVSPEEEQPEADPREHWAFRVPQRPDVPNVEQASNVPDRGGQIGYPPDERHPIDAFIDHELARNGLVPRPVAPKHVLLRRVSLDLIGLPPTREELHDFLADDSPAAYEKVVDRLLADPRHGERWGRHWMDVWRYSDWYGRRDVDDVRNSASQMFRWRDWIVRSLNNGQGYDQMVQKMLAADEMFPEDYEAGVATGFLIRNYYSLNSNDWMRSAVEHTGKAFLGLTFNCAHCHDHKYDPIAHDDYFRLRAFFEPIFIRQDRVPGEVDPGVFQDYTYSGTRGVQRLGAVRVFDRTPDAPTWFYTGGDERNRVKERGSIPPDVPAFLKTASLCIEPVTLPPRAWYPGLRPEIQETMRADAHATIRAAESELVSLTVQPQAPGAQTATSADELAQAEVPHAQRTFGGLALRRRAAEAKLAAARAALASLECRIAAEIAAFTAQPPAPAHAPTSDAEGAAVASSSAVNELARAASHSEREARLRQAESDLLAKDVALLDAEAKPADDQGRVMAIEAATASLAAARTEHDMAQAAVRDEKLAEIYSPLSQQFPRQSTGRRGALAWWITSCDNPLTARVAVNHIWTRHFHTPLVASMYDFGRNGDRPTHPELLDWLAVEFMDSGWNMKYLHRRIVTSAAYRRNSSAGNARNDVAADPENKLLCRMNLWRMESEVVRDSLLYVAGRLDLTQGGVELENKDALTTNRRTLYYSSYPEAGGKSALGELFDAPDPLDCYRRVSSIVPQQALALTNSDMVQQSGAAIVQNWAASRKSPATGADDSAATREDWAATREEFIVALFETILSRQPSPREREVSEEILARQQQLAADPNSPDAWRQARESLARILLNHNDFITVR